jgi:hypothetical protein
LAVGEVAVADAYLAGLGRAAFDGFRTMFAGQFQTREAAAAEIETGMDQPAAALAAGYACHR